MRNHVRHSRSERSLPAFEEGHERDLPLMSLVDDPDDVQDVDEEEEFGDVVRLYCPDCRQPITVFTDEESLPGHALCATPWNPFGLTVCPGSGRPVDSARPADALLLAEPTFVASGLDQQLAPLLTLPAGLDWRTQPFSHVGGPGSRPVQIPVQRAAA